VPGIPIETCDLHFSLRLCVDKSKTNPHGVRSVMMAGSQAGGQIAKLRWNENVLSSQPVFPRSGKHDQNRSGRLSVQRRRLHHGVRAAVVTDIMNK
ncbi:hypothetical protein, partial [Castellaniella sp.]|uniref:hypothetical protein n=1 Tax=Castellaniella sp. TaxID=1955812 RepID=UPI002AFE720A